MAYLATEPDQSDIAAILASPTTEHPGSLLAALADHQTTLTSPTLISLVQAFLSDPEANIRRVAALALHAGGPDSLQVLQNTLPSLPPDIAADLGKTLRFSWPNWQDSK
jgi:hypothetical protein